MSASSCSTRPSRSSARFCLTGALAEASTSRRCRSQRVGHAPREPARLNGPPQRAEADAQRLRRLHLAPVFIYVTQYCHQPLVAQVLRALGPLGVEVRLTADGLVSLAGSGRDSGLLRSAFPIAFCQFRLGILLIPRGRSPGTKSLTVYGR